MHSTKAQFIEDIMEETVILYEKVNKKRVNKKQEEVISQLEKLNYAKHENSYNFLLHMRIDSFTEEHITKLRKQCDDLKEKITNLTNTITPLPMG